MNDASSLLEACSFPGPRTKVSLAVSGGPDSLGLLLLALAADLSITVHHVDHHARPTSGADASAVVAICESLGVPAVVHDAFVTPGGNFEERARTARRAAMPQGVLTGHTMDDLAETMLINLMRGAGHDGLSPFVDDPTKPIRALRRLDVHAFVERSGLNARVDETNLDPRFTRNRVRHEVIPLLNDVARRDVVPLLARQASLMNEERRWLDALSLLDAPSLDAADCRELREWPRARLRRWLRECLTSEDLGEGNHPPNADEVERAIAVVHGEVVATELSGGRRLSRRAQRLTLQ